MSTRDKNLSFCNDKKQSFGSNKFSTDQDAQQFSNCNLNQVNNKSSDISLAQFKGFSSNSKQFASTETPNHDKKERLRSMQTSFNQHSKLLSGNDGIKEEKTKQLWKRDKSTSGVSNSTLTLHIEAYENSHEAASDGLDRNKCSKKEEEKPVKKFKNVKQASRTQASFEFPRQQDEIYYTDPEVMQFKSSSRLLNPNELSTSNKTDYNNDPQLVHDLRVLRKRVSDQETLFEGLEADYKQEIDGINDHNKILVEKVNLLQNQLFLANEQITQHVETIDMLSRQDDGDKPQEISKLRDSSMLDSSSSFIEYNVLQNIIEQLHEQKAVLDTRVQEMQATIGSMEEKIQNIESKNAEINGMLYKAQEEKRELEEEVKEMRQSITASMKSELELASRPNMATGISLFDELAQVEKVGEERSVKDLSQNEPKSLDETQSSCDNGHNLTFSGQNTYIQAQAASAKSPDAQKSHDNGSISPGQLIPQKTSLIRAITQEQKAQQSPLDFIHLFPRSIGFIHTDQNEINFQKAYCQLLSDKLHQCQTENRKFALRLDALTKELSALTTSGEKDALLQLAVCRHQLNLAHGEVKRLQQAVDDMNDENHLLNVKNIELYRMKSALKLAEIKNKSNEEEIEYLKKQGFNAHPGNQYCVHTGHHNEKETRQSCSITSFSTPKTNFKRPVRNRDLPQWAEQLRAKFRAHPYKPKLRLRASKRKAQIPPRSSDGVP